VFGSCIVHISVQNYVIVHVFKMNVYMVREMVAVLSSLSTTALYYCKRLSSEPQTTPLQHEIKERLSSFSAIAGNPGDPCKSSVLIGTPSSVTSLNVVYCSPLIVSDVIGSPVHFILKFQTP
jgi:hypothetical protein